MRHRPLQQPGGMFVIEVNVPGDEKIEPAVAIVIAPGCTSRPVAKRYASLFS